MQNQSSSTHSEKPILYNTAMVKAVLSGRKTQTRRVIKPQPYKHKYGSIGMFVWRWLYKKKYEFQDQQNWINACPYGQVGDRLWVRERFCIGEIVAGDSLPEEEDPIYIEQLADSKCAIPYEYAISNDIGIENVKWKPSIFMRREYSRTNLEITNIRVERVQDITPEDALAEGINMESEHALMCIDIADSSYNNSLPNNSPEKAVFIKLWDSINQKRGYGWDVNPWVWVVEFKVL